MGTRADFYIGSRKLTWLGSIGWDGYPEGIAKSVLEATSREVFLAALEKFFERREDVSRAKDGWPWPWDTSATTDYTYVFNPKKQKVYTYSFDKKRKWPNMKSVQKVTFGNRSGPMVFGS